LLVEPLDNVAAKALIRRILSAGQVALSHHVSKRLKERSIDPEDVLNVLRGGLVDGCDMEDGTWRYRVRTPRFYVVVAFRSEDEMRVVTAWRIEP